MRPDNLPPRAARPQAPVTFRSVSTSCGLTTLRCVELPVAFGNRADALRLVAGSRNPAIAPKPYFAGRHSTIPSASSGQEIA